MPSTRHRAASLPDPPCRWCNWGHHPVSLHGALCSKGHPVSRVGRDDQGRCRECHRLSAMRHYGKNREAENARSRAYHAANREAIVARKRSKRKRWEPPGPEHPWRADAE